MNIFYVLFTFVDLLFVAVYLTEGQREDWACSTMLPLLIKSSLLLLFTKIHTIGNYSHIPLRL